MSGDFENNINQRMQDFRITPGPQIWERVAAALPAQKKRRRFVIWWWLLPLAACLGGGIWLGIHKPGKPAFVAMQKTATQTSATKDHHEPIEEKTTDNTTQNDTKQTTIDVNKTVPDTKQTGMDMQQPATLKDKQEVTGRQSKDINKKETVVKSVIDSKSVFSQPVSEYAITKTTTETEQSSLLKRHNANGSITEAELDYVLNYAAGNAQMHKAATPVSAFVNKQLVLPVPDSSIKLPQEIVVKDSTAIEIKDTFTTALAQKQTPSAKRTVSKTSWSLVFAAGSSSLNGSSKNENKALYANSISTGTGFSGNASRQFIYPTAGLNFSAGIIRRQAINKHWNWQAAFYYQFLTSHQITGSSNDSLRLFQTFTDAAYTIIRLSGNSGTTTGTTNAIGTKRTNQVHRLQIVPGVQFTINPSSKSPINFSAGATIAYNLGNRLLLHDYRSYSYIRSSKFSNNLLIGAEGGVDIFINRKIHTGIFFGHDFTNVAKPQLLSAFHWNQLQLRAGIPLSKRK